MSPTASLGQPTLLMLGAGPQQIPAIRAARAMGLRVVAVDPRHNAPGFDIADGAHLADLADRAACLDIARTVNPDGIATFAADFPVRMVAYLTDVFSLPGVRIDAAWAATAKDLMRDALAAHDVPVPQWTAVTTMADGLDAMRALQGPGIIKPALSAGSRGITHLDPEASETSLQHAFERAHSFEGGRGVLIEEFIDGPEYSVEAVTHRGETHIVAITDKVTTGPPYWVETAHSQPTALPPHTAEEVRAVTLAAIDAIGIDSSVSHTELRVSDRGPVVMEIAARAGGGYICSDLVPRSTGVDLARAVVDVALGNTPELGPTRNLGAAVMFITPEPGLVRAVHGIEEAGAVPGVQVIDVEVRKGDIVPPLLDTTGRVGHVIAEAATAAAAMELCRRAVGAISIVTRP